MMTGDEIIKILEENTAEHLAVYMSCHTPNGIVLVSPADILDIINCKNAEIERLKSPCEMQFEVSKKLEATIKAEAIKKFAERLKEKAFTHEIPFEANADKFVKLVAVEDIDNLVKEMVGES